LVKRGYRFSTQRREKTKNEKTCGYRKSRHCCTYIQRLKRLAGWRASSSSSSTGGSIPSLEGRGVEWKQNKLNHSEQGTTGEETNCGGTNLLVGLAVCNKQNAAVQIRRSRDFYKPGIKCSRRMGMATRTILGLGKHAKRSDCCCCVPQVVCISTETHMRAHGAPEPQMTAYLVVGQPHTLRSTRRALPVR